MYYKNVIGYIYIGESGNLELGFSLRLIATELVFLLVQPSGAKSLYSFLKLNILLSFYCEKKKKKKIGELTW